MQFFDRMVGQSGIFGLVIAIGVVQGFNRRFLAESNAH